MPEGRTLTEDEAALLEAFAACVERLGRLPRDGELRFTIRNGRVEKRPAKLLTYVESCAQYRSTAGSEYPLG
jgi:hypothetical protein